MLKKILAALLLSLLMIPFALADDVLRPGDKGEAVSQLQTLLASYGYFEGTVDGIYGESTTDAVKLFQEYNDLKKDGKAGPKTMKKLTGSNVVTPADVKAMRDSWLKKGSSGEEVKVLQQHLKDTLFYNGKIDGVFGDELKKAVTAFQKAAGLQADGIAGDNTKNALYQRTASIFNGGIPIRTLYTGLRGYDVKILQQRLAALNYFNAPVTGYYCEKTAAAVSNFQRDNGMNPDGKTDAIVRRYLWPSAAENTPSRYPELKEGSTGTYVSQAQMRLKAAGFLHDTADGVFGENTLSAVKAFQKSRKLTVDGKIGKSTWEALMKVNMNHAEPEKTAADKSVLRPGDTGDDVKELQKYLRQLGYDISADGAYGTETTAAVKDFQKAHNLTRDGKAGPKTRKVLYALLSK